MKKFLLSFILILEISLALTLPVQAAVGIPDYYIPKNTPLREFNTELVKNSKIEGMGVGTTATNRLLQIVANSLIYVAAPLAILFIAHGGQAYAFAFGEETKIGNAKKEIMWALIGLIVILGSYMMIRFLLQVFVSIPNGPTTQTEAPATPEVTPTPESEGIKLDPQQLPQPIQQK